MLSLSEKRCNSETWGDPVIFNVAHGLYLEWDLSIGVNLNNEGRGAFYFLNPEKLHMQPNFL